jgi:serine protease Do
MFAFPTAKRLPGLAASLLSCLLVVVVTASDAAAEGQAYLGVKLQDLTPSMAKALQLDDRPGVLINEVVAGSPAQKAGLVEGDVILQLNGQAVSDYTALTESVRALAPDHKAGVLILRDGKQKTIEVELGKRESLDDLKELENLPWPEGENPHVYFYGNREGEGDSEGDGEHRIIIRTMDDDRGWLGVKLDALNGQLGEYFGVKDGAGVLVTEVVEDGPAAKAGLLAGDVIVKVGDADVASPDALHEAMTDTEPGDDLLLQVLRKGSTKTMTAKLGEIPEGAVAERQVEIMGDGGHGDMKMFAPRILRQMGRPGQDVERKIIIERKQMEKEEMDAVRQEMDALRQELKLLREELKR